MIVKVINKSKHELPKYETKGAAGLDLKANLDEPIYLNPLQRIVVPSGLFVELPEGYEFQNRPKSGLASKKGIVVVLGTIDSDYRGEVCAIVFNLSSEIFVIEDNMKISQLVLAKVEQAEWQVVEELSETERGSGGFGSTGK